MLRTYSSLPMLVPSLRLLARVGFAGLLLSCGGGGGGGSTPAGGGTLTPPPNTIYVGGQTGGGGYGDPNTPILAFTPTSLTVAAGTTVTWVWQAGNHSVDSGSGCTQDSAFTSGGLKPLGNTMTHTFNTKGTYPFFCTSHCAGNNMKGTITVN